MLDLFKQVEEQHFVYYLHQPHSTDIDPGALPGSLLTFKGEFCLCK